MPSLLLLSFATLFLGPVVLQLAARKKSAVRFIDAFILCSVCGIVVFHVIPDSLIHGGAFALAAGIVGLFGPLFASRFLKHGNCHIHHSLLSLASLGLLAHAMLDGMALFGARHDESGTNFMLAVAVVLHRLPEGVGIWRLMTQRAGNYWAFAILMLVALATAAGFYFGETIIVYSTEQTLAVFEGLMAGVLLHVIFHRHHLEEFDPTGWRLFKTSPVSTSLGALSGIALVLCLFATSPIEHSHAVEHHSAAKSSVVRVANTGL